MADETPTTPENDPSLTSTQVQHSAPFADPVPQDQAPKVDAGDSGATVGTPGSYDPSESQARAQAAMDEETDKGYRGWNPDPTPNEAYTLPGVLGQNSADENAPEPEDPGVSPEAREDGEPSTEAAAADQGGA